MKSVGFTRVLRYWGRYRDFECEVGEMLDFLGVEGFGIGYRKN